ncbi:TetR family transcriptional regulator C-terminal domain-containing protein [Nocardia sp. NPDC050710]|uniref:TetR family transcriptional regulator C-terminal domain-containing protein n=1 Tax=Nocardia sp. NPDC050710 TaxID=3157220 RepID=UPI0033C363BD
MDPLLEYRHRNLIRQARDVGTVAADVDDAAAAERLTALVEGLSERWHSGSIPLDRARHLLVDAITIELGATTQQ